MTRARNPYHGFDMRSLLAARELLLWDLADVDENPDTWQYPESSRAFIVDQIALADDVLALRRRNRHHPFAPSPPDMRADLETIKQAIDLPDLIERLSGVQFERRGKRVWTSCPLPGHQPDVTPSFCVTPEKQLWCCFGCRRGGDAFTFVELLRDVPFPEAVSIVSNAAGIPRQFRARHTPRVREGVMRVG